MGKNREIKITYNQENKENKSIKKLIFSFLFVVLFSAEFCIPMEYNIEFFVTTGISLFIGIGIQYFFRHKKVKIGIFVAIALATLVIGIFFSKIWVNGAISVINDIIDHWNREKGTIYSLYVTNDVNVQIAKLLFLFSVIVLFTVIVNIVMYFQLYSIILLLNFIVFAFFMMFQKENSIIVISIMILLVVAFLSTIRADKELIRHSKLYFIIIGCSVSVISAAIFVSIYFIPDTSMNRIRNKTIRSIEESIYGKTDLTDGDLSDIPDHKDTSRVRLYVETNSTDAIYLKGFVGSKYTGNSWTDLDKEAYQDENKSLQQYLIEQQYSPLMMLSMFFSLSDAYNHATYDVQEVSYDIENISASEKYIYMPYTSQRGSFDMYDNIDRDINVKNSIVNQKKEYHYDCLEIGISEYPKLYNNGCLTDGDALKTNEIYLNNEQAYHEFADQYYLEIPENVKEYFDKNLSQDSFKGTEEITEYIRKYLKDAIVYTDEPQYRYSGSGDFIIELLEKNKQGYGVHYATAATMMFRYYGIPARYVEGYRRPATGEKVSNLYQRNAHAWVEIYRYGMGWVPIDVTPGYYVESKSEEQPAMSPSYTPTQTPVVEGVTDSQSDGGNPPQQENDADNFLYQMYMALWWLLILILLVIIIILIRRKIILYKQKKRIQSEDWKDSILFMAGLIWRLCKRHGIKIDQTRPENYTEEMNEYFKQLAKIDFKKILSILNRVNYSKEQKDDDDYIVVKAYMDVVRNFVYDKAKPWKKMRLKYIDVLR